MEYYLAKKLKIKKITDACHNMAQTQNLYVKCKNANAKAMYYMIPFIWNSEKDKTDRIKNRSATESRGRKRTIKWL